MIHYTKVSQSRWGIEDAITTEERIHKQLERFALFMVASDEQIPSAYHGLICCDCCPSKATYVTQFGERLYCDSCYSRYRYFYDEQATFR